MTNNVALRVYKTKAFSKFARKAGLEAPSLLAAARAVESGHWDADLGGGVFKQRIARIGAGKSGGFRTIILFRHGRHSFFVHGFAKSDRANISDRELGALQALATVFLGLDEEALEAARAVGELEEIGSDDKGGIRG